MNISICVCSVWIDTDERREDACMRFYILISPGSQDSALQHCIYWTVGFRYTCTSYAHLKVVFSLGLTYSACTKILK